MYRTVNALNKEPNPASLIQLLTSARPDERWLRAVALTRSSVPLELQNLIVGRENVFQNSPDDLIRIFTACTLVCHHRCAMWPTRRVLGSCAPLEIV